MGQWLRLEGGALLYTVSLLTCLSFLLIGYGMRVHRLRIC